MARGTKTRVDQVTDIKSATKSTKDPEWFQYVEDISSIGEYPDAIEYEPDEGESLRKLRVRVTKAANSQDIKVTHRETARGTLLVFKPPTEGRRAPRRRKSEGE